MKKFLVILAMLALVSCKTCPKCPVIHDPIVMSPTVACYVPPDFDAMTSKYKSNIGATTDGQLLAVAAENVTMLEENLKLWDGYRVCVETSIKIYDDLKKKLEAESTDTEDKTVRKEK